MQPELTNRVANQFAQHLLNVTCIPNRIDIYSRFGLGEKCGSPIEEAFVLGWLCAADVSQMTATSPHRCYCRGVEFEELMRMKESHPRVVEDAGNMWSIEFLFQQVKIANYRADFVLVRFAEDCVGMRMLDPVVVECDGKQFNDATADQLSRDRKRDRDLQLCGYRVFRFTGSELWADPIACVRSVHKFFNSEDDRTLRDPLAQPSGGDGK